MMIGKGGVCMPILENYPEFALNMIIDVYLIIIIWWFPEIGIPPESSYLKDFP